MNINQEQLKIRPADYLCPVCNCRLLKTPGGYYVCPGLEHTRLLGDYLAKDIYFRFFLDTVIPAIKKWRQAQLKATKKADGKTENDVLVSTSIRGVYLLRGRDELFRATKQEHLIERTAVRLSKSRRKKKTVTVRSLRGEEIKRLWKRGAFEA